MGLDLTIYPLRGPEQLGERSVLAYNRLRFDQEYLTFSQLTKVKEGDNPSIIPLTIPPQMWVDMYKDEGIERTRENPYGKELVFVYAREFKKLQLPDNASPRNKAIKAFVDALSDDIPIILEWE